MRVKVLILLCFVWRIFFFFAWDPASALLNFLCCRRTIIAGLSCAVGLSLEPAGSLFCQLSCFSLYPAWMMSAVMLFHSRIAPPAAHCLEVSFGPASDVFIVLLFLFSPLLISLRLMVFVRSVSNSGGKSWWNHLWVLESISASNYFSWSRPWRGDGPLLYYY